MIENNKNIAIVILAAGSSSRMGKPKQLLFWSEDSLLNNAIKKALKATANEIIVVLGANYTLIEKEIKQQPVTILNNKNWNLGLGSSIAVAANYLSKTKPEIQGLLVALSDQPLVTTEYLNSLIDYFCPNEKQIIASSYSKNNMGVPALFNQYYFKELSKLNTDKGAKELLNKYKSIVKILVPKFKNIDIDSKEDYKNFTEKYLK